jgi:hypothetical protein
MGIKLVTVTVGSSFTIGKQFEELVRISKK